MVRAQFTATLLTSILALPIHAAGRSPGDLRLQWSDHASNALSGRAGDTVVLRFVLRNVGGEDAFAAVLKTNTTLGPFGPPIRLQPGPAAGVAIARELSLPLAIGMKEVCIHVTLQTLAADDPADPNPVDNRICRALTISPRSPPR